MADSAIVHIGENSPEHVAYRLLVHVAASEGYLLRSGPTTDSNKPSRQYILDTYAECLKAARGYRG